uniref:Uncharacterized protein n=1 Tax=Branchiostoma floridae TaxID=7739 RepID=C3Z5Q2_BRAFL|eukprot:XP_002596153.1 hypothetical protein BRAFLDRAFT_66117 [Branchiostoma floridae]
MTCGSVTWIFLLSVLSMSAGERQQYAMYVWADGYDPGVPGCTETDFLSWTNPSMNNNPCFTHSGTHLRKGGREISTIFLAGLHRLLEAGYNSDDCMTDGVQLIKATLRDGYHQVPGLQVYALYAVSDLAVSEQLLVKHVVWYNDACAGMWCGTEMCVQVAYVTPPEMARRAKLADYDYAVTQGKNIFITSYTEKVEPCQITFFPQSCAPIYGGKSEAAMFAAYDQLVNHGVGNARPCIEYYRGVYCSGGNSDWPRHDSGVPVDLPDPAVSGPDRR